MTLMSVHRINRIHLIMYRAHEHAEGINPSFIGTVPEHVINLQLSDGIIYFLIAADNCASFVSLLSFYLLNSKNTYNFVGVF
jgi:hypothetical protein